MKNSNCQPSISEESFLSQRVALYNICATLWIVGCLAIAVVLLKGLKVKLVPWFIEPMLIKYDWLTIIYFPVIAILFGLFLMYGEGKYKWYCKRINYRLDNGDIILQHRDNCSRINPNEVKRIDFRIRSAVYPLSGRGIPMYNYYDLLIECRNEKYRFCSTPFQHIKYPDDFMQFIACLESIGLKVKLKDTVHAKIWKVKNKIRNKS